MMVCKLAWKVLKKGMKSSHDNMKWEKGKWYKTDKPVKLCVNGFHASKLCTDALSYVTPGIICKVEYKGNFEESNNKLVASEMKVIDTYRFTKEMTVKFAIFCARLCLQNFEKEFPDDKRPRLAIEAAERYVKYPTEKNKLAAQLAWSAAQLRVQSTTWSAVRSVWLAAESAAWSAESAAWSAKAAVLSARAAAQSTTKKKMNKELLKIIGEIK